MKKLKIEEKDKLILQLKIIRDSFFGDCLSTKDKQLLLEDLSARLPYGVKVTTANPAVDFGVISGISIKGKISVGTKDADIVFECTEVKPYLRPMSSMTDEEKKEYYTFQYKFTLQAHEYQELNKETFSEYLDWLNKNMFDYRGLIEKGLAIEVTKDNNPYKE